MDVASTTSLDESPRSVRVIGRRQDRENADICGEYFFHSLFGGAGHVAYVNHINGVAIRFSPRQNRWMIDRGGVRDADVCVAYADATAAKYPGPELIWHVWEDASRAYFLDTAVVVMDAPECVTFVGRQQGKSNHIVNGKYSLCGAFHGKAAYQHQNSDFTIRYDATERRWVLSHSQRVDNSCIAWADTRNLNHPGDPGLQWHFWEFGNQTFLADLSAGAVISPDVVHLYGSSAHSQQINGTYHLVGVHCFRPMYSKLGTQVVIRYSHQSDRWLIDCDGLSKPSVFSRAYQWVMNGVSEQTSEQCSAWAAAAGSEHPGDIMLHWHVWESFTAQFRLEPNLISTSAPLLLECRGREVGRENSEINGEYRHIGIVNGSAAYEKIGSRTSLYRHMTQDRWVIDLQGIRNSEVCTAYAECCGAEHPLEKAQHWHIYESSRAIFVHDPSFVVVTDSSSQACMMTENSIPNTQDVLNSAKRSHVSDEELAQSMQCPPAKMARIGNQASASRWFRSFGGC